MCIYSIDILDHEMNYMMDYPHHGDGQMSVVKQEAGLVVECHCVSCCSSCVQCSQGWRTNTLASLCWNQKLFPQRSNKHLPNSLKSHQQYPSFPPTDKVLFMYLLISFGNWPFWFGWLELFSLRCSRDKFSMFSHWTPKLLVSISNKADTHKLSPSFGLPTGFAPCVPRDN